MKRRTVLFLAVGATVVAIGAGVTTWWLLSRPPGPEAAALAFLEALADGEAHAAISLVESPPEGLADAFDGATGLIGGVAVQEVDEVAESTALAHVAFTLDGEEHTASFGLIQTPEGWRVATDALGTIIATTTIGDSVRVGDRLVPVGGSTSVLPAVYPVTAAPAGLLEGTATVAALPGEATDAAVEASLSPTATALATERLDEYIAACTATAQTVPPACGLRVPWAADLESLDAISFRVETTPTLVISPDARTFAATGGVVVATATGTGRDGAPASVTYRADDWALRGGLVFRGDTMTLTVD